MSIRETIETPQVEEPLGEKQDQEGTEVDQHI